MAWSGPPFSSPGAVLVGSDDGCVDHGVFVVGVIGQNLEKILPYARLCPTREAGVNILPRAEAFRQIAPRRSRAELPNNSVNEKPVASLTVATHVTGATRQQLLDASKLIVAQSVAFHPKAPRRKAPHKSRFSDLRIP